jgi:hypothetical protein
VRFGGGFAAMQLYRLLDFAIPHSGRGHWLARSQILKREISMRGKAFFSVVGTLIVVFASAIGGWAQNQVRLGGLISDFTPAHDSKGNPTGPWVLHGTWRLNLNGESGTATFSAAIAMENSDYWLLINHNPPADPDSPSTRTPHTHHITMKDATVVRDPSFVMTTCPSAAYKPPTTTGFVVKGWASVTANGGFAPFAPTGQLSPLTVCITGGTQAELSNVTLMFGLPASGHFGSQPINGVVRQRK